MKDVYLHRYIYPLMQLWDGAWWKAVAAMIAAALQRLFVWDVDLTVLVAALILMDWLTGMLSAYKRGEPVVSKKMRQTVVKAIEYTAFLAMANGISHGLEPHYSDFGLVDTGAYAIVVLTEAKSITENLFGARRAKAIIALLFRRPQANKEKQDDQ